MTKNLQINLTKVSDIDKNEYSITIATCANKESARKIAKLLIERQLAACVQMFPVESVYIWKDEICYDNETVLFVKSKTVLFNKIMVAIKENHTYEIPEIIQIPITGGLSEYLKWIDESTLHENVDNKVNVRKIVEENKS